MYAKSWIIQTTCACRNLGNSGSLVTQGHAGDLSIGSSMLIETFYQFLVGARQAGFPVPRFSPLFIAVIGEGSQQGR